MKGVVACPVTMLGASSTPCSELSDCWFHWDRVEEQAATVALATASAGSDDAARL